jgi:hypothetical protein
LLGGKKMNEKNQKNNKKIIAIFVLILMIATIVPVTGISNQSEHKKNVIDTGKYQFILFIIGRISDLTIDGNDYYFHCENVRSIWIDHGYGWSYEHLFGYNYGMSGFSYKGILNRSFICGYFYF